MGYMRHHAILVTCWDGERIEDAHRKALDVFGGRFWVTAISVKGVNGYRTFAVFPDGSKEGWEESDLGDAGRDVFVAWLKEQVAADGGEYYDWIEVQYGDDNGDQRATRASKSEALKS